MNGNTNASVGGNAKWFEKFIDSPFPHEMLPSTLGNYIDSHSDRFSASRDFVAVTALAQLAGVLARNNAVCAFSGSPAQVSFSVIIGTPDAPGYIAALRESNKALADLQAEKLEIAARLSPDEIKRLKKALPDTLPDYAKPVGEWKPGEAMDAKLYALDTVQRPVFFIDGLGHRELRNCLSASYDRTLFASFSGGLLARLASGKPKREDGKCIDLLSKLVQECQIDLPTRKATQASIVQPHFGMLCLTSPEVLQKVITHDMPEVQAILQHSVFLNLPNLGRSESRVLSYPEVVRAGSFWKESIRNLLEARRSRSCILTLHPSFYEPLTDWNQRQQAIAEATPASLRIYLPVFYDLPMKLGSLFLALQHYGGFQDSVAAAAAVRITEWIMAHTLLTASQALRGFQNEVEDTAKETMLAKIRELGPVDFWQLRRRFNKQNRALHQPTLEALIEERRVRIDESGKLVAA